MLISHALNHNYLSKVDRLQVKIPSDLERKREKEAIWNVKLAKQLAHS